MLALVILFLLSTDLDCAKMLNQLPEIGQIDRLQQNPAGEHFREMRKRGEEEKKDESR